MPLSSPYPPAEYLGQNETLQGSCFQGGHWYLCLDRTPNFMGCCVTDPCNPVGCPINDLRSASLGPGAGPDACKNDSSLYPNVGCPTGSDWYTCLSTTPSFQGCCTINPCHEGSCPRENLYPAIFKKLNVPPYTRDDCKIKSTSQRNIGTLVGGVVGGVALLALTLLGIYYFYHTRKSKIWYTWSKAIPINSRVTSYKPQIFVSSPEIRDNIIYHTPQDFFRNPNERFDTSGEDRAYVHELDSSSSYHPVDPKGTYNNDLEEAQNKTSLRSGRNLNRCSDISDMTVGSSTPTWSNNVWR